MGFDRSTKLGGFWGKIQGNWDSFMGITCRIFWEVTLGWNSVEFPKLPNPAWEGGRGTRWAWKIPQSQPKNSSTPWGFPGGEFPEDFRACIGKERLQEWECTEHLPGMLPKPAGVFWVWIQLKIPSDGRNGPDFHGKIGINSGKYLIISPGYFQPHSSQPGQVCP